MEAGHAAIGQFWAELTCKRCCNLDLAQLFLALFLVVASRQDCSILRQHVPEWRHYHGAGGPAIACLLGDHAFRTRPAVSFSLLPVLYLDDASLRFLHDFVEKFCRRLSRPFSRFSLNLLWACQPLNTARYNHLQRRQQESQSGSQNQHNNTYYLQRFHQQDPKPLAQWLQCKQCPVMRSNTATPFECQHISRLRQSVFPGPPWKFPPSNPSIGPPFSPTLK